MSERLARRIAYAVAAPVLALVFSLLVSSFVLALSGDSAIDAYRQMWEFGTSVESIIVMLNRATPLYIAGIAVAIGFKMNLFNIGVEGQFRVAALIGAWAGAELGVPGVINIFFVIVVAMVVGATWAGGIAILKVTRGVHEVVSSIMLNYIAYALISFLLLNYLQFDDASQRIHTRTLPTDSRMPSLNAIVELFTRDVRSGFDLNGFVIVAAIVGALYYVMVFRTRFGYDLRASGANPWAARASGVDPKRMIVTTMLLSGAVAGLIGMPEILGQAYWFSDDLVTNLGFTGIGVALLGRNHPVGIAGAALLFGFLDRSSQILDLEGIPPQIVVIMQGVIIISVVIAYEVVARIRRAQEARATARIDPEAVAPARAGAPA